MVNIEILKGLMGAFDMLLEEGYIEKDSKECDKLFLYPFALYVDNKLVDRIYHVEYCNLDEDGEYDDFKTVLTRTV